MAGFDDWAADLSSVIEDAGSSSLDQIVVEALAGFGEIADVDRIFATLVDDDGLVADDWEWARPGCPLVGPNTGSPFREMNGSALALLRRGRTVAVSDLSEVELSASERDFSDRHDVRAVAVCPIRVGQTLLGIVGLTKLHEPRHWSQPLLDQLQVFAHLLVPAVARTRHRAALAVASARARRIADFIPDGLLMLTPGGTITWASPSFTRSSGQAQADLEGMAAISLVHPDDEHALTAGLAGSGPEVASLTVRMQIAGEWRWSELTWRLVSEPDSGAPDEIVLSIRDVHDERLRRDLLAQQALTDPLTGVRNRDGLERALADLSDRHVVVAFCDIDRFKAVNDVHGHAAGDDLLRAVAHALTSVVRPGDVVARVGGDEFVVVIGDATPAEVDVLEARLRAVVGHVQTDGGVSATASIGLSGTGPATSAATLRHQADEAMYRAKRTVAADA